MINKLIKKINQERRIIYISLFIGFVITLCFSFITYIYSKDIQNGIAKSVIRFHVIANSDFDYDQNLKIIVRDEVLNKYSKNLKEFENINQTREFLIENSHEIQNFVKEVISKNGYNYDVNVYLSEEYFPTKIYGDMSFPAGKYEAFKIVIGEGKGHNWWCVMFPPLCFVDITHSSVSDESKQKFKTILSDEQYSVVTSSENTNIDKSIFKVKFKIVEWWNSL